MSSTAFSYYVYVSEHTNIRFLFAIIYKRVTFSKLLQNTPQIQKLPVKKSFSGSYKNPGNTKLHKYILDWFNSRLTDHTK